MSLENANYIWELVPTNPGATDPVSQGDDHLQMIKRTLQNSFPGMTAPWETSSVIKAADPVAPTDLVTLQFLQAQTGSANIGWPFIWVLDDLPVQMGAVFNDLDGTALDRIQYAELFALFGIKYGLGNGTSTFNIPDMRGYFLRTQQPTFPSRDPDIATRTARSDGATQGAPGTTQIDGFKSHTHGVAGGAFLNAGGSQVYPQPLNTIQSTATGGTETRPLNINIRMIMRIK